MRKVLNSAANRFLLGLLALGLLMAFGPTQAITIWAHGQKITIHIQAASGKKYDPVTEVYVRDASGQVPVERTPRPQVSSNDRIGEWFYDFPDCMFNCEPLKVRAVRFFTHDTGISNGQSATFTFYADESKAADGAQWKVSFFDSAPDAGWTVGVTPTESDGPPKADSTGENTGLEENTGLTFEQWLFLLLLLALFVFLWIRAGRKKDRPDRLK